MDNRNLNGMLTLRAGAHAFGIGFQKMIGNDAFPVLNGYTPPYVANLMTIQTFTRPRESPGNCATTMTSPGSACPV